MHTEYISVALCQAIHTIAYDPYTSENSPHERYFWLTGLSITPLQPEDAMQSSNSSQSAIPSAKHLIPDTGKKEFGYKVAEGTQSSNSSSSALNLDVLCR
jgi:hypothetical protein